MQNRKLLLDVLAIALIVLVGAWWHGQAGLSMPFPCGDEVVFYYPAQALAQHGTLASVHLDPNRAQQWMPPGYMAVLAGWIKLVGVGLLQARWLSFWLASSAFVGFWAFWRRMGLPMSGLLLVVVVYLSRHWVGMGKMVRMEGLLICLIWLLLWAVWEGKTGLAIGLALAGLTVHPNALYFLLALPVLAGLSPSRSLRGRLNIWALVLGLVIVAGYAWYVLVHIDDFIHDWRWQATTREAEGWRILALRPDQAVFWLVVLGLGFWVYKHKDKQLGFVLLVAIVFWAIRILGQGWAYGIFNVLALTLVLGVGLVWAEKVAWPWLSERVAFLRTIEWAFSLVAVFCLIVGLAKADIYTLPLVHRAAYYWNGMPMQPANAPYLTETDKKEVLARLRTLLPAHSTKIYFMPEGDGVYIAPDDTGRVVHVLPVFGENMPEYIVVHEAANATFFEPALQETKEMLPKGVGLPTPFYTRDSTERWYLLPVVNHKYPPYILQKGDSLLREIDN
jgi:hypothetical protein